MCLQYFYVIFPVMSYICVYIKVSYYLQACHVDYIHFILTIFIGLEEIAMDLEDLKTSSMFSDNDVF